MYRGKQPQTIIMAKTCLAAVVLLVLLGLCISSQAQECKCGLESGRTRSDSSTKVIGGQPTKPGRYPWVVYIRRLVSATQESRCTGAVIASRWIMTAAHCVTANQDASRLEVLPQQGCGTKDTPQGQGLKVVSATRAPGFRDGVGDRASGSANDIALLELRDDLPDQYTPICLDDSTDFDNFFVAGWGREGSEAGTEPDCLQEAELKVQPLSACRIGRRSATRDLVLCAGGGSTNTCQGDSGGALMTRSSSNGRIYAAGVVSNGPPCDGGQPSIYEKVAAHLQWIRRTTKNAVCVG